MSDRRVVVTGLGILCSAGEGVEPLQAALRNGRSCLRTLTEVPGLESDVGGRVPDFDPARYMPAKLVKRIDRASQLFVAAAHAAVQDGELPPALDPGRVGVFGGTATSGLEDVWRSARGEPTSALTLVTRAMSGAASAAVSARYGFQGPVVTFSTGSVSSACAIGGAFDQIRLGRIDAALAGGSDAPVSAAWFDLFRRAGLLSPVREPEAACRPFDVDRGGTALGEGGAVLLLEERAHAEQRGAHIYAEILAVAQTCDAGHPLRPQTGGTVRASAMTHALQEAGREPQQVGHLIAHGTGTVANDRVDARAVEAAFGPHVERLHVTSLKSMLGHTLGACTAVESVAAILAMNGGFIPPTAGLTHLDPECGHLNLATQTQASDAALALVSSAALGGRNTSIVIGRS